MLQDLSFGKLENQYKNISPKAGDRVLCFKDKEILVRKMSDGKPILPEYEEFLGFLDNCEGENNFCYAFTMQGVKCFLWMGDLPEVPSLWEYVTASDLRSMETKELCFLVMTGLHLSQWYRKHRFCGGCATPTVHDDNERMLRCPNCGNMIFPVICPAVIIAVTDGDRLVLSKYAGRNYSRYALLAGFTEIGETMEETVAREVMEEVGLKVKNIRYYKSQPWGVDGGVLMGFFCDLDGDDTIEIDENELSLAEWYNRDSLPAHDDGISLTREMIGVFEKGMEPK